MIPRLKPAIRIPELLATLNPLYSDDIEKFEGEFADLMQQKYALAFPYGRTGLLLLLETLGFQNKEIICPAYTCVVVPHAVIFSGNRPIFIDCETTGFNMDLEKAEKAITGKTAAIIATSIFGYPVNLDQLAEIKKKYPHVEIVQDCAHSFSAEWNGRPVQKECIAAVYGLNISKILTSVFGGIITTDNENLFKKLAQTRNQRLKQATWQKSCRRLLYSFSTYLTFFGPIYSVVNRLERLKLLDSFVRYYDETKIEMPTDYLETISKLEARIGRQNLKRYPVLISLRREAAEYYHSHLEDTDEFKLPPLQDGATYSHYAVQVKNREYLLDSCLKYGVQLGRVIEYNIPEMPCYGSHSIDEFPISANYARSVINLPVWGGEQLARRITNIFDKYIF